jgi:tetratricopeptide (TPR) repeat protein
MGWSALRSLRRDNDKYIQAPRPELYRTDVDPLEKNNLFTQQQALGAQMQQHLDQMATKYQGESAEEAGVDVDSETRARLASLGYASLSRPHRAGVYGEGVDPKDGIDSFEAFHFVVNQIHNNQITPAVLRKIDEIRNQAPEVKGLDFLEGQAREKVGDLGKAYEAFRRALAISPGNSEIRSNVGRVLIRLGRAEEAEAELLKVVEQDPKHVGARNTLAGLFQTTGRTPEAIQQLEVATREQPDYLAGWTNLASLYMATGELEKAEESARTVVELAPGSGGAHFRLSEILKAVGKESESQRHRAKAIELNPRFKNR